MQAKSDISLTALAAARLRMERDEGRGLKTDERIVRIANAGIDVEAESVDQRGAVKDDIIERLDSATSQSWRARNEPTTSGEGRPRHRVQEDHGYALVTGVAGFVGSHLADALLAFPWLHVRATPGESFVPTLGDLPVQDALGVLTSPDWFRFCFVRNPYDRVFAAYKSFIMRDASPPSPFYRRIAEEIRTRQRYGERGRRRDAIVCFRDFVQYVQEALPERQDYHWCQMTWGLRPDLVRYDVVGHFESFAVDFGRVLQRLGVDEEAIPHLLEPENEGPIEKLPLAAVYDWDLAEQVYGMYQDDFSTYGYEKHSWLGDR